MSRGLAASLAVVAAVLTGGCNFAMRRTLDSPGQNQTVRVESGERLYFTLDEDTVNGYRWSWSCDDPDVKVTLDRRPGKAKVELRIHRGYDGPSVVSFRYGRKGEAPVRRFTIGLYRRTGDCAFWE